jgi:predicted AAA+ superfamily ATPase
MPRLKKIFTSGQDLNAQRIIRDLSLTLKAPIIPGKTLLFLDEVQSVPEVIIAVRYLYEQMPDLHVIVAGSLINFALDSIGVPVGRIEMMYLYPLSWLEFLYALGHTQLCAEILNHDIQVPETIGIHEQTLDLLKEYLAIGGMPEVVSCWINFKDIDTCAKLQQTIINSYRQDFHKYAKQSQIKYVELVFDEAVRQIGKKFQFKNLREEYRKRELSPALDLLEKANVIHQAKNCH